MLRVAFLVPVAVGLNVMLIEQFAPAASVLPQVFAEIAKSPGLVPLMAGAAVKCSVTVPLLVMVTD